MIVTSQILPIRFCVGERDSLTSHSWRVWSEKKSELYLACRDDFKDIKVSLHSSGRWRMGFTEQAAQNDPRLVAGGRNRVWDVWEKPAPLLPDIVVAFSLYFPKSEFLFAPEKRAGKSWKDVSYIKPARDGRVNVITLCIGRQGMPFEIGNTYLGRFDLPEDRWAHLVAHDADESDVVEKIRQIRVRIAREGASRGQTVPTDSFGYFLAEAPDGRRSLVGLKGVNSEFADDEE